MELNSLIKLHSVCFAAYFLQCFAAPDKYLQDQGVVVNEGTRYLARCLAGAILSIVVISYHAAWKGTKSDLISVAWAGLFTNVVWLATSVNKYYLSKAKPTFFNKVDMTVCGSFAALFAYALYVS